MVYQIELDEWQKEVMLTKGNMALRSGRQTGKSTVVSMKAAQYAVNNRGKTVLVIAAVERQAQLLFEKILGFLADNHKGEIKTGKFKPTKHVIRLKNGSNIHCLPTGLSGYGIRGYTVDLLIADEAAFIPEDVWTAVTPMLAVTKGILWLLSTPFGRQGFFHGAFKPNSGFTTFHISSEDCPRKDEEFLKRERARMTEVQYAQEYLGEFVDELRQFFSSQLIKSALTLDPKEMQRPISSPYYPIKYFMGADIARFGGDETVLASFARINSRLKMFDLEIYEQQSLTYTVQRILDKESLYKYTRIYIDDGGLGAGVLDPLLDHEKTRRKVEALNNSARPFEYDPDKPRVKRILKVDLYTNLLRLMEQGLIAIFDTPEVYQSFKSVQYEIKNGQVHIFGKYTHIVEAIIRAAWSMKDKTLNIWISSF